jgi:hypothetical protein
MVPVWRQKVATGNVMALRLDMLLKLRRVMGTEGMMALKRRDVMVLTLEGTMALIQEVGTESTRDLIQTGGMKPRVERKEMMAQSQGKRMPSERARKGRARIAKKTAVAGAGTGS